MTINTTYDQPRDVLYVKDALAHTRFSQEHPIDGDFVLNYDGDERVVGIQLLYVSLMRGMWHAHPGRRCLPGPIRDEVDRFMSWLEAGPLGPDECSRRTVPPQWLLAATA